MEEFLTIQVVSRSLNVSEQSLRLWIKQGKLKAIRVGRGVRIAKSELERFLQKGGEQL